MTFTVFLRYIEMDDLVWKVGWRTGCFFWVLGGTRRMTVIVHTLGAAFEENIDGCSGCGAMMRSFFVPMLFEIVVS